MGSSGATKTSGSSTNEIAPELQPLYSQTGGMIQGMQADIAPQFGGPNGFFSTNPQFIPGFTDVGNTMAQNQIDRYNQYQANPYTPVELDTLAGIRAMTSGPLGQSPQTLAAMNAVRTPVLNDMALAGMGNSDAIASNLAGAFSPILAQEMAARQSLLPLEAQMSQTGFNRQPGLAADVMNTQDIYRQIEAAQAQANTADFLRRQQLGQSLTTGVLGGFPSVSGTISSSKQTGGGK